MMHAELIVIFFSYKLLKMIIGFYTFSAPINPIFYSILIFFFKL